MKIGNGQIITMGMALVSIVLAVVDCLFRIFRERQRANLSGLKAPRPTDFSIRR
ncbi:MAG: hypothetical protein ACLUSP_04250 [Christensenellales bacterium]